MQWLPVHERSASAAFSATRSPNLGSSRSRRNDSASRKSRQHEEMELRRLGWAPPLVGDWDVREQRQTLTHRPAGSVGCADSHASGYAGLTPAAELQRPAMRSRVAAALSDCTIKDLTDVAHIMRMRSGEVTAMMMRAVMILAAMKVTMTTKAIKAKAEARTSRRLQKGRNSRRANIPKAEVNGKDEGEGQQRA